MKSMFAIIALWSTGVMLWAQQDSLRNEATRQEQDSGIRISKEFMKELENAFEFVPRESPVTPPEEDILTREQLHKWVGDPDSTEQMPQPQKFKYDSMYVALKLYLKDLYIPPAPKFEIFIPGITDRKFKENLPRPSGYGFDVNALAKYVRPSEIKLRKSRALCKSSKSTMDKFFPIDGLPFYSKQDAAAVDTCYNLNPNPNSTPSSACVTEGNNP